MGEIIPEVPRQNRRSDRRFSQTGFTLEGWAITIRDACSVGNRRFVGCEPTMQESRAGRVLEKLSAWLAVDSSPVLPSSSAVGAIAVSTRWQNDSAVVAVRVIQPMSWTDADQE